MSNLYGPIGFYATCDDAYCVEHLHEDEDCKGSYVYSDGMEWDGFEGWDAPLAIFASEEVDTPTHCQACGELIEHALTPDGYQYVAAAVEENLREGIRNPVVHLWADRYGDGLDDLIEEHDLRRFFGLPVSTHPALRKYAALLA